MTDIKLVLLSQAHFFLLKADNTQKSIFLQVYSRTLKRINVTLRRYVVCIKWPWYIKPREKTGLVDNILIYSLVYFFPVIPLAMCPFFEFKLDFEVILRHPKL